MTKAKRVNLFTGRAAPYSARGIRRKRCIRCQRPAYSTWQVCANNNLHVPVCAACDVELNKLALQFMGLPDWPHLMLVYRGMMQGELAALEQATEVGQ